MRDETDPLYKAVQRTVREAIYHGQQNRINALEAENAKLRAALEGIVALDQSSFGSMKFGQIARRALEENKDE